MRWTADGKTSEEIGVIMGCVRIRLIIITRIFNANRRE
ncbi:hypothetical protein [Pseudomonas sp. FEN]